MRFEAPQTIEAVLERIHRREYVLPAIQREFVWSAKQIESLFDSLMRGYPIGAFLFWDIKPENMDKFSYFDFVTHRKEKGHNEEANIPVGRNVLAVLDGQQRLTAFNIALNGSFAEDTPGRQRKTNGASPAKRLYFDLCSRLDEAGAEETMYSFRFLSDEDLKAQEGTSAHWFPVPCVLKLSDATEIFAYIQQHNLGGHPFAFKSLNGLVQAVREIDTINYYLERSTELDKVLNIFIRANSAGTFLSYSDLLLSIATAKWDKLDARSEIHDLVDAMNEIGWGWRFGKDRVLKACLVLADFTDIRFKVDNFNVANMLDIEKKWTEIRQALIVAVRLLDSFGLWGEILTAENVLVPLAYYAKHRKLSDSYVESAARANVEDRERIRSWVLRSMLSTGFWTGAVDSILIKTREIIQASGCDRFPSDEIEAALAKQGKPMTFDKEEIEDLLDRRSRHKSTFLLLSLIYPGVDVRQNYHIDHVFPKARMTEAKLRKLDLGPGEIATRVRLVDTLPNLQLLEGSKNVSKSKTLPKDWVASMSAASRRQYLLVHDLGHLPDDEIDFTDFYEERRGAMRERLRQLLC